jgi:hypothetical protein
MFEIIKELLILDYNHGIYLWEQDNSYIYIFVKIFILIIISLFHVFLTYGYLLYTVLKIKLGAFFSLEEGADEKSIIYSLRVVFEYASNKEDPWEYRLLLDVKLDTVSRFNPNILFNETKYQVDTWDYLIAQPTSYIGGPGLVVLFICFYIFFKFIFPKIFNNIYNILIIKKKKKILKVDPRIFNYVITIIKQQRPKNFLYLSKLLNQDNFYYNIDNEFKKEKIKFSPSDEEALLKIIVGTFTHHLISQGITYEKEKERLKRISSIRIYNEKYYNETYREVYKEYTEKCKKLNNEFKETMNKEVKKKISKGQILLNKPKKRRFFRRK